MPILMLWHRAWVTLSPPRTLLDMGLFFHKSGEHNKAIKSLQAALIPTSEAEKRANEGVRFKALESLIALLTKEGNYSDVLGTMGDCLEREVFSTDLYNEKFSLLFGRTYLFEKTFDPRALPFFTKAAQSKNPSVSMRAHS